MLSQRTFDALAAVRGAHCVSIYMPTYRFGRDVGEGPIRLGNLLREAEQRLVRRGVEEKAAHRMLASAQALVDRKGFWQEQDAGLALFLAGDEFHSFALRGKVEELVVVGDRFCLRPLLAFRESGQEFFLLALSKHGARLFECSEGSCEPCEVPDMPESLEAVVGRDVEQKSLQFHTTAAGGAGNGSAFHGHGHAADSADEELRRYVRAVDQAVTGALRPEHARSPLVLAAVRSIADVYRHESRHPAVLAQGVDGNPDALDGPRLYEAALPLVASHLSRATNEALTRVSAPQGTTHELARVLLAAGEGRVDTLCILTDRTAWGRFDPDHGGLVVHRQRQDTDEDLLDLALASSLATGAHVFGLRGRDELPRGGVAAAALRHGV